jgi:hypothetical protein
MLMRLDVPVPLSAYVVQQDFINSPNDTDRGPSYFNQVPASLRRSPGNFIPHTFAIGDTFQTNFSLFGPYTISSAYARNFTPGSSMVVKEVPSFAYQNHDLTACDVFSVNLDMDFPNSSSVGLTVRSRRTQLLSFSHRKS